MKRLLSILMVTAFGFGAAWAQQSEPMKIEIRDGRVFVDGVDVGRSDAERIQITREDGEVVNIVIGKNGTRMWSGDKEDPAGFFERLEKSEYHFDEEGFPPVFFRDGDGIRGAFRFKPEGGDPAPYDRLLENLHGGIGGAADLLGDLNLRAFGLDPEIRAMERQIAEKAREVRRASGDERDELEAELDELLSEAFALRLEAQREEAEELRERLNRLETRLAERDRARSEIIARKKRDLLGERDVLDW